MEQAAPQIDEMDERESIEKAKSLMAEEKWGEAIALLNPFKEAGNLSTDGLHILAYCYSRIRKYNEAIKIYEALCGRFPNEAKWFYSLAYQYKERDSGVRSTLLQVTRMKKEGDNGVRSTLYTRSNNHNLMFT